MNMNRYLKIIYDKLGKDKFNEWKDNSAEYAMKFDRKFTQEQLHFIYDPFSDNKIDEIVLDFIYTPTVQQRKEKIRKNPYYLLTLENSTETEKMIAIKAEMEIIQYIKNPSNKLIRTQIDKHGIDGLYYLLCNPSIK